LARILLTGATSGIGLAAATTLAGLPHQLVLHGPESEGDAADVVDRIARAAHPGTTIRYVSADFTRLDAPRRLAERVLADTDQLDVLINNAAIPGPLTATIGAAGTELAYQVNYLAGTLLTHHLLPRLHERGRIVNVASATHFGATLDVDDLDFRRRSYSPSAAYAQSKLAIVTYSNWLATRVAQTVVSIHPGVVSTRLLHAMFAVGGGSTDVGGANLANAASADLRSGTYLDESTPSSPSPESLDRGSQEVLVADTVRRLGVPLP
jgi:NAD(P)-dependent dehydrogenase (short-subunit alcohol dehydrogenase family)